MSVANLKSLSDQQLKEFLDSFDTVLTDCDGVLWVNAFKLPNSAEVMNTFRSLGKRVFFVTNNSTKTRKEFVQKCQLLDFIAEEEDVLCTSQLVATYLKDMNFKKKAYVVGSLAIGKELEAVGIQSFGWGADSLTEITEIPGIKTEAGVGAVVIGFDEHFSYPKMLKAASYLADENVHFIATNADERFPTDTIICPGTGALVRCIETCSERKATVLGKPEPFISSVIKKEYKVDPERTLMIGDRANTDILLGTRCGFKTLLVFSGVTSLQELEKWKQSNLKEEQELLPDFYTDKLGDLLPILEKYRLEKSSKC